MDKRRKSNSYIWTFLQSWYIPGTLKYW